VTLTTHFQWTSASRSHVGLVRRVNEDSCLDLSGCGPWAVADGMGGHARGDVASSMVVDALEAMPGPANLAEAIEATRERLQEVNRQLCAEAVARGVSVIGSTVVVLLAVGRQCGILWAGDSRIYLCRGAQLSRLTRDHSQVEELVASGSLPADEAAAHPAHNLITRAVGATAILELDDAVMEVQDGDMFLLCSDGLTNEVAEDDILGALVPGDCRQAAEDLVDLALAHGGRDNVSVVVVHAEDLHSLDQTVLNPAL
jgi:protein phosphatase